MKKLVIFDLDGTLLDTIGDIACSTNHALAENGFALHETSAYRRFVGNGIMKLFERALPAGQATSETLARMRASFIAHYSMHNCDLTRPYDGIKELLARLSASGVGIAVASNKYDKAVKALIGHFFPETPFTAVEGNKENVPPKPDPAIVNGIISMSGCSRSDVLFVGDSCIDMQTAANAQVDACGVTWGFSPESELLQCNPAHIVHDPAMVADIALG